MFDRQDITGRLDDAEQGSIALRIGASQLFMAFDGGARIAAFDYTPTMAPGVEPPKPGRDCAIS